MLIRNYAIIPNLLLTMVIKFSDRRIVVYNNLYTKAYKIDSHI